MRFVTRPAIALVATVIAYVLVAPHVPALRDWHAVTACPYLDRMTEGLCDWTLKRDNRTGPSQPMTEPEPSVAELIGGAFSQFEHLHKALEEQHETVASSTYEQEQTTGRTPDPGEITGGTGAQAEPSEPQTIIAPVGHSSATGLSPSLLGRTYRAGPVLLQLGVDGTFKMDEVGGDRKVVGRFTLENGILTLSDPQGDVGNASFPLRCRVQQTGDSFTVADDEGSCPPLDRVTFRSVGRSS